jgi:hypothetical protein
MSIHLTVLFYFSFMLCSNYYFFFFLFFKAHFSPKEYEKHKLSKKKTIYNNKCENIIETVFLKDNKTLKEDDKSGYIFRKIEINYSYINPFTYFHNNYSNILSGEVVVLKFFHYLCIFIFLFLYFYFFIYIIFIYFIIICIFIL